MKVKLLRHLNQQQMFHPRNTLKKKKMIRRILKDELHELQPMMLATP